MDEWLKGFETKCGELWLETSCGFKKEELTLIKEDKVYEYFKCDNGLVLRRKRIKELSENKGVVKKNG